VPQTEHFDAIRNSPLFTGLTEGEKDVLLEGGEIHFHAPQGYLFRQGDGVEYFYIVCKGIVREFRKSHRGSEITVNIHGPGNAFCTAEMFLKEGLHQTSAAAVDDAHVMKLPIQPLKKNLQKYKVVLERLICSLAQFAFMKQVEVEQQATMTATQIVAAFLRQICASHELDPGGFELPYSKSLIASRLGMEGETLSRTLHKLRQYGITVRGNHVSFHDAPDIKENVRA